MKSRYSKYLSANDWLITEPEWSAKRSGVYESAYTLGNGYLGMRGIYEEIPDGTEPGTYIAGVFDSAASMVTELVNCPNPIDFRIVVEGEKLDISRMNILENRRVLDLGRGLLVRRTVFSDTKNRRFLYESIRFMSLGDIRIGGMQIYLKALDKPARIIVQDTIDDSITNIGSLLEGRKRHTQLVEVTAIGDMNYLCVKTFTRKIWLAYATHLAVARGAYEGVGTLNKIFNMALKKGESVCFTKLFSIHTSRDISARRLKQTAINDLKRAKRLGFDAILERTIHAWRRRWDTADIRIKNDDEAQKALRFNIYHLIISGSRTDDDVSIGARTLSGDGYRGHIFWDTEIFILPFFIYTNPAVARNLLMYRYYRLNEAREIARKNGYKGVLFPWESAESGAETTPPYAKNVDGSIIEIHTMDMEHHIVSDVAYGIDHYYTASDDVDFMLRAGLEIIFETARFWASRVVYNRKRKRYEIRRVIGPDEFHEDVNNSAFVNTMAQWNLRKAKAYYESLGKTFPRHVKKICRKIALEESEVRGWDRIADRIAIPVSKSKGIIEEFDGYLKKRNIVLQQFDQHFMPVLPRDVEVSDFGKTQLIKQADIAMLMYLLPEHFTPAEKELNYRYYVARTLHKSSLSPSIYAIIGSEVGDIARGYLFFLHSLHADLRNTHGNTKEGIHGASLGGTWQAVVMGFCGFRIMHDMPSFEPRLPGHWQDVTFSLAWKRSLIEASVSNKRVNLFIRSKRKKGTCFVKCFNSVYKVPYNKAYTIRS